MEFYKKTLYVLEPELFNKLPGAVKELNRRQFEIKLHYLLVILCYYNIDEFLSTI